MYEYPVYNVTIAFCDITEIYVFYIFFWIYYLFYVGFSFT